MTAHSSQTILCDTHVHFYDCFDTELFLDCAWSNFAKQAKAQQDNNEFLPALMLTEAKQDRWFGRLMDQSVVSRSWSFTHTEEDDSLLASNGRGQKIIIINGRQIVTSENLEVLALATTEVLPDGSAIDQVIDWVIEHKAIPVIPWGFGKWWGKRGNILSKTLEKYSPSQVHLGDNSGRPWFLGHPDHFKQANSDQRRILPGSDPLPFHTEACRAGSVGITWRGQVDEANPSHSIREYLKDPGTNITPYMHTESLVPFMRNQVAMQVKKRT